MDKECHCIFAHSDLSPKCSSGTCSYPEGNCPWAKRDSAYSRALRGDFHRYQPAPPGNNSPITANNGLPS